MTRRDQGSVISPNWTPEKQVPEIEPGAAWGDIQCVPAKSIPDRASTKVKVPYGTWSALVEEIMLRLEQTPRKEALHIPFINAGITRRAAVSVWNIVNKQYGSGVIEMYRRGTSIYIRRGENWDQLSDPDLAALAK